MKYIMLFFVLIISSCSTSNLTVRIVGNIVNEGIDAFYEEDDLQLARVGMESNIKLIEVLYKSNPENKNIRIILSQIYAGYTFAFLETDYLLDEYNLKLKERINNFYSRGLNYGLSVIYDENPSFKNAILKSDFDKISKYSKNIKNEDALFWTILNWSLLINMNRTSADRISEFPKVQILIDQMISLNKNFFYSTPLALKATINSVLPKMFGGNAKLSKVLFTDAINNNPDFLLHKLLFAQYTCPALQDKDKFNSLINDINKFDINKLPRMKLLNKSVKIKAKLIYDYTSELFLD